MNSKLPRIFAFVFPLSIIFLGAIWFCFQSMDKRGVFIYALDDPYIHLAIAKNFAFHGVWGITSHEFTSASSSPLWTAMLAICLKLSGSNLMLGSFWPFALNLVSSLFLVWVLWRESLRYLSPVVSGLISAVIVFTLPAATLIVSGQEHVLHCAVVFLLIAGYARVLSCLDEISIRSQRTLLFLTSIVVLIRYESLFLIAVFGLLLLGQKRLREALLFVGLGTAPAIIFGIISVLQGWPPVPNSIWLKAEASSSLFSFSKYAELLNKAPEAVFCLFVLILTWSWLHFNAQPDKNKSFANDLTRGELKARCALLIGLFLLHLSLARVGWLFRYEAYLLFASTLVFLPLITKISLRSRSEQSMRRGVTWVLIAFTFIFVTQRAVLAVEYTNSSLLSIRDQQWQMARLFSNHFPQSAIALNDIGAVSYFRDSPVLDLFGLANLEVAKSRSRKQFNSKAIDAIAHARNVEFVAIYPDWFDSESLGLPAGTTIVNGRAQPKSEIPTSWIRCADWNLQHAYFGGEVAFFATSPQSAEKLRTVMREFAISLPPREICTIIEANGKRRRAN